MPRVDEILTKYGEMIENVLSGQGKVGAILRRGAIYDSLNAGRPSTVAAQPQYSPGLPDMSGAPQNANESLSDLMTFVGSLGSGAVGDPNEGVNWAGIDAQRANKAVDIQGLMDQRATQQAGMINESNLNQDQINSQLGQAGADARINADQVELGGAALRQREQSAVDDLLAQLAEQQEKRSMFDEGLASDQQIAERALNSKEKIAGMKGGGEMKRYDKATGEEYMERDGVEVPNTRRPPGAALSPYQEAMISNSNIQTQLAVGRQGMDVQRLGMENERLGMDSQRMGLEASRAARQTVKDEFDMNLSKLNVPSEDGLSPNEERDLDIYETKENLKLDKERKKELMNVDNMDKAINNLDKLVKKYGSVILPSPEKAKLESAYMAVAANLKDFYKLGTLDAGVERLIAMGVAKPFEPGYPGIAERTRAGLKQLKVETKGARETLGTTRSGSAILDELMQ